MSSVLHGIIRRCSKYLVAPKGLGGISLCAMNSGSHYYTLKHYTLLLLLAGKLV